MIGPSSRGCSSPSPERKKPPGVGLESPVVETEIAEAVLEAALSTVLGALEVGDFFPPHLWQPIAPSYVHHPSRTVRG